jgi:hypothetical protein
MKTERSFLAKLNRRITSLDMGCEELGKEVEVALYMTVTS